jgi:hypothetical protein
LDLSRRTFGLRHVGRSGIQRTLGSEALRWLGHRTSRWWGPRGHGGRQKVGWFGYGGLGNLFHHACALMRTSTYDFLSPCRVPFYHWNISLSTLTSRPQFPWPFVCRESYVLTFQAECIAARP